MITEEQKKSVIARANRQADELIDVLGPIHGANIAMAIVNLIMAAEYTENTTKTMQLVVRQLSEVTEVAAKEGW